MRAAKYLGFAAFLSFAISQPARGEEAERYHTSEEGVKTACGKDLQTNEKEGVKGCTKGCMNGKTCDYSCGGKEGEDCRVYVFSRTEALPQGKAASTTQDVTGAEPRPKGDNVQGLRECPSGPRGPRPSWCTPRPRPEPIPTRKE